MSYEEDRIFDDYEWEIEQGLIENPYSEIEEDEIDELESYGIDRDEFDTMDDDEKREALEEAGLDPDDFGDEFLL
ncbi:MAG: hypothetical protein K6E16_04050 [Lachnospiraceae bacterium]|nr:hypothetical protein [Lachnospiraceae bacterium]